MAAYVALSPLRRKFNHLLAATLGFLLALLSVLMLRQLLVASSGVFSVSSLWMVLWTSALSIGTALTLTPLRDYPLVAQIADTLFWPAKMVMKIGYLYAFITAPFITFGFIYIISQLLLVIVFGFGLSSLLATRAVIYLALVATSLMFTYKGQRMVEMLVRLYEKEWDFTLLHRYLEPNRVRAYVYGLLAVVYTLANTERFSGITLVPFAWWMTYKDIALEVLLTLGTFDAALLAYTEHWRVRPSPGVAQVNSAKPTLTANDGSSREAPLHSAPAPIRTANQAGQQAGKPRSKRSRQSRR